MTLLGYARVSTLHQSPGMQTKALTEAGAEKIWTERMSGARDDHPELAALLDYARRGDVLMVWRLARRGPLTPPPAHESPVTSFACRGYSSDPAPKRPSPPIVDRSSACPVSPAPSLTASWRPR